MFQEVLPPILLSLPGDEVSELLVYNAVSNSSNYISNSTLYVPIVGGWSSRMNRCTRGTPPALAPDSMVCFIKVARYIPMAPKPTLLTRRTFGRFFPRIFFA